MKLDIEAIKEINLSHLAPDILDEEARGYFMLPAGQEHYKLLAWLSTQFNGVNIADIGTYKGASAVALAYNTSNMVHSYDVSDMSAVQPVFHNLKFNVDHDGPMWEDWLRCSLIMLDTVHDGIHERAVINWLIKNDWHGLLILDDIGDTFPEQKKLWEEISLPKWDVTEWGHWAGSGIIQF